MNSHYVFIRSTQNYLSDFVGAGLAGLLELKSDFRIGLSGDDSGTLDRLMEMIVRETGSGRDFSEHLLLNTGMTVKEIAAQTGYVDSCCLSRLFVRHYGVTPLQYRRRRPAEAGLTVSDSCRSLLRTQALAQGATSRRRGPCRGQ